MEAINPTVLKRLREAKGWSQADLQERSRVDKQSISRIERGERKHARRHTCEALAKALGTEPEVLVGRKPVEPVWDHRSAMTVRVDDATRNALDLAARRYRVRPEGIVELAPYLFVWAAEASLRWRTERLRELERRRAELHFMQADFPHLDPRLTISTFSDEVIAFEEKAISRRDIFATDVEWDPIRPGINEDFEAFEGPIVQFLRGLKEEIGSDAEFESWHPMGGPSYSICQKEAVALVGGDEKLAARIIGGAVQLHKMPPELRRPDRLDDRVAWVRQEIAATDQKHNEFFGDLDLELGEDS